MRELTGRAQGSKHAPLVYVADAPVLGRALLVPDIGALSNNLRCCFQARPLGPCKAARQPSCRLCCQRIQPYSRHTLRLLPRLGLVLQSGSANACLCTQDEGEGELPRDTLTLYDATLFGYSPALLSQVTPAH